MDDTFQKLVLFTVNHLRERIQSVLPEETDYSYRTGEGEDIENPHWWIFFHAKELAAEVAAISRVGQWVLRKAPAEWLMEHILKDMPDTLIEEEDICPLDRYEEYDEMVNVCEAGVYIIRKYQKVLLAYGCDTHTLLYKYVCDTLELYELLSAYLTLMYDLDYIE